MCLSFETCTFPCLNYEVRSIGSFKDFKRFILAFFSALYFWDRIHAHNFLIIKLFRIIQMNFWLSLHPSGLFCSREWSPFLLSNELLMQWRLHLPGGSRAHTYWRQSPTLRSALSPSVWCRFCLIYHNTLQASCGLNVNISWRGVLWIMFRWALENVFKLSVVINVVVP